MGAILVISRDPAVAHAVCTFLSPAWPTVSAYPGVEAENLISQDIDVVIMDVKTPEAAELQFIRKVKRQFPDLPVIFLSLYAHQLSHSGDPHLFQDALFFSKPFDNEAVAAAVAMLSSARRRAGSNQSSSAQDAK